jgi:hypothetical protein
MTPLFQISEFLGDKVISAEKCIFEERKSIHTENATNLAVLCIPIMYCFCWEDNIVYLKKYLILVHDICVHN